jgi:hypothetical protein
LSRSKFGLLAIVLVFVVFVPQVFGHAPLAPGNNESLATATVVPDATKSWAIYSELHEGGEAQYYRFDISEGQRIHVSLLKSPSTEDKGFVPSFVLMGPKLASPGALPTYVQVPEGVGTLVVEGKTPAQATYEAFSPSAFYQLADVELDAPSSGTYYVVVFEPSRGGHYGLAIGDRESFTLSEWTLAPLNFISIYQWEGESLPFIFAPLAVTLALGIALLLWNRRSGKNLQTPFQWIAGIAGLLFLASSFTIFSQILFASTRMPIGLEVIITIVFASVSLILGFSAIRLSMRKIIAVRTRLTLLIVGVLALFAWSGFIAGPIIAVIASMLPHTQATGTSK